MEIVTVDRNPRNQKYNKEHTSKSGGPMPMAPMAPINNLPLGRWGKNVWRDDVDK